MEYAIDRAEKIEFEGNNYYIRVKSANESNPVVLFLHGGCGSPDRAQIMKFQSPLADRFTLVAWDQRGTGLAYNAKEARKLTVTKDVYVEDAHNVVLYLKKRFNKEKIIIVGHSFGSALGVWLADKYPEDISAYFGIGQVVDYLRNEEMSYDWTLEEATRVGDKKSVKKLKKLGRPINGRYKGMHQKKLLKQRAVLHKLGGATYANRKPYWQELLFHDVPILRNEYTLSQLSKYVKGLMYVQRQPIANENPDFLNTVHELKVPVFLLLGHHDFNCPCTLAEEWLEQLVAPKKGLVWFEQSAHSPQWEEPDLWNEEFAKICDTL